MAKKVLPPVPEPEDPTAWILENGFAEFVLMHTNEIVSLLDYCIVPSKNMDKIFVQGHDMYSFLNSVRSFILLEIHGDAWIYLFAR